MRVMGHKTRLFDDARITYLMKYMRKGGNQVEIIPSPQLGIWVEIVERLSSLM